MKTEKTGKNFLFNTISEISLGKNSEWVNIHAAGSFDSEIANDYNLFATPSMFLIDENHKIIAKPTTIGELEKNIGELE